MRTDYFKRTGLVLIVTVVLAGTVGYAQGNLNPSSAPGATMKTLDQVEPRTPISSPGTTITQPGSYYLATNLVLSGGQHGILVACSDVNVDLNGFTIFGKAASSMGIFVQGVENVTIANGTVRDCQYNGIYAYMSTNCVFQRLRVLENARESTSYAGIVGGIRSVVRACDVSQNGGIGIKSFASSVITGNRVEKNANYGLWINGSNTYVDENIVKENADNYKIDAGNQVRLLLCEVPEELDWPCLATFAGTLRCPVPYAYAIRVNSPGITIDMAGHSLIGLGDSTAHGIYDEYRGAHHFTLKNGTIKNFRGSVYHGGVYVTASHVDIEHVHSVSNRYGFYVGPDATMKGCHAVYNSADGIAAGDRAILEGCIFTDNVDDGCVVGDASIVTRCIAGRNGDNGFVMSPGSRISASQAHENGGSGMFGNGYVQFLNCSSYRNAEYGYSVQSTGYRIKACTAAYNDLHGIHLGDGSLVSGCELVGNGAGGYGAGLYAYRNGNRIEGNQSYANDVGYDIDSSYNIYVRNTARANDTNWVVSANNYGMVIQATGSIGFSGNSGGGGLGSTNPNANFTY